MARAAVPAPDPRELLPPLLACLSIASASKQPPAALLPLLSPILRQRIQLLASDDWLPLLSWDSAVGAKLPQVAENIHVEPHPASGEIEVEEPDQILYRRSDPETLHTRLVLGEHGIIPTYLWCTAGDDGNRWKLADLRGIQDNEDGTEWYKDMAEADKAGFRRKAIKVNGTADTDTPPAATDAQPLPAKQDEDDDAYWAAYDQTPGQTPQQKRSPAPLQNGRVQVGPTQTELEYFARYASEVQPAMDPHDPDEELPAPGESTVNGDSLKLHHVQEEDVVDAPPRSADAVEGRATTSDEVDQVESTNWRNNVALDHPRPSSSASTNSVERLERSAESYSQAELAIKQHISTDMKSLFRLARTAGIDREEFERIIQRELEVLPLLEREMS